MNPLLVLALRQPAPQDFQERQLFVGTLPIGRVNNISKGHFSTELLLAQLTCFTGYIITVRQSSFRIANDSFDNSSFPS
jgi:hypothetical protein